MDRKKFYDILKKEELDIYNIGDSKNIPTAANVYGCIFMGKEWIVYKTDERQELIIIDKVESEEKGLLILLEELRNEKKIHEIMKKLDRKINKLK